MSLEPELDLDRLLSLASFDRDLDLRPLDTDLRERLEDLDRDLDLDLLLDFEREFDLLLERDTDRDLEWDCLVSLPAIDMSFACNLETG